MNYETCRRTSESQEKIFKTNKSYYVSAWLSAQFAGWLICFMWMCRRKTKIMGGGCGGKVL